MLKTDEMTRPEAPGRGARRNRGRGHGGFARQAAGGGFRARAAAMGGRRRRTGRPSRETGQMTRPVMRRG